MTTRKRTKSTTKTISTSKRDWFEFTHITTVQLAYEHTMHLLTAMKAKLSRVEYQSLVEKLGDYLNDESFALMEEQGKELHSD
jgi:hypothetical protein